MMSAPVVPVSWGELLDKISILEIKAERIPDARKRANIERERAALVDDHTGLVRADRRAVERLVGAAGRRGPVRKRKSRRGQCPGRLE